MAQSERSFGRTLKRLVLGKSRDPRDVAVFRELSLVAFFAWVGLGADGLSSSCYGPAEAFLTLGNHPYLGIFVGLGSVITILVIAASYSQIVELFPTGGGGYFVATKLLSPWLGMVSGCALLIDYVLTIAVSIASGADAIFSFLPLEWHQYKLELAVAHRHPDGDPEYERGEGIGDAPGPDFPDLSRHARLCDSVRAVHALASQMGTLVHSVRTDVHDTIGTVGFWGLVFLVLRSYSMGAGTYTGIEAVSNGMPVLREPRVHTARLTMRYMAISLAFIVMGLILGYLLYGVGPEPGKTLNAVLFDRATASWNRQAADTFILISLLSEAILLSVAAQTGFLGGPRVLANMSLDRWFPTRFSVLSDRLVIQNGILIMGGLALVIMLFTRGSVRLLVVLYSINVFITFTLSQLGMVRHWWRDRGRTKGRLGKLLISGVGLVLTSFILVSMVVFKFFEGGWVTLLITGALIVLAILIRRHYQNVMLQLRRLDELAERAESYIQQSPAKETGEPKGKPVFDPKAKTAVLLVSGFNGTGLHTLLAIMRLFGGTFRNFIFLEIGQLDVGTFKGPQEVEHLQTRVQNDLNRYVNLMNREGFYAEAVWDIGVDTAEEITRIVPTIIKKYPARVLRRQAAVPQ